MLELAKAVSFLVCILSIYWAAISAFFVPGAQWEERLWLAAFKLLAAAAICFYSGMVFSWPSRTNPTAFQRLTVHLARPPFLLGAGGHCGPVYVLSWYLADSEAQAHGAARLRLWISTVPDPCGQGCCSIAIRRVPAFPVAAIPTRLVATPGSEAGVKLTVPSRAEVAIAGLGGQQLRLGASPPGRARRSPRIKRLVQRHRSSGHGLPFMSSTPQRRRGWEWPRRRGSAKSPPRLKHGVFRPRSEGRIGDALAGAVQAGGRVACWPSPSGPTVSVSLRRRWRW